MTKEEIQKNSEHWYNKYKDAEKRITDLENKIADIKANCDFALEGKDVEIKELKDHLAEEIELHLHAEEYIKSLEKENAELKADNDARKYAMAMSEKVEKQLREENARLKKKLEHWKSEYEKLFNEQ